MHVRNREILGPKPSGPTITFFGASSLNNGEIKKLKQKKKEILKQIELLDKRMKRGKIGSTEYFKEFDNQKALLVKINNKIAELEEYKKQRATEDRGIIEPIESEDLMEIQKEEEEVTEEVDRGFSLSDKIKSHLPHLPELKIKMGGNALKTDVPRNIDGTTLRNFKFFHENRLSLKEHPNFIHLAIRDFLEGLGYKVMKIKKPLPEMIELEQGKSIITEIFGYLIGVKKLGAAEEENILSIFIRQEGICTIFFDGHGVTTSTKAQISLAGNTKSPRDEELEKDIIRLNDKIMNFT
jgi:hypothetical protein